MAKLTDRQRTNIYNKYHTGEYNKSQLAKRYKVDEKVIRNIVGKEEPKNSHIVEAGVMLESLKKSELSPNEIQAVNHAIEQRLKIEFDKDNLKVKIYETQVKAIDKISKLLDDGKYKKPIKIKNGDFDVVEQHDQELSSSDFKNCVEAIDKASVTLNINERFGNSKVEVNQNNSQILITELPKKEEIIDV
jgi:transposase